MQVSVSVTDYTWPAGPAGIPAGLRQVVEAADEAGINTVWVADHLIQADPTVPADTDMLEAFTTLGYLAARTTRVRLGTLVAAATFRPPALLVKAVTTLDVLSGGRAWLGVGAGYQEDEARAMGLPLPPVAERFEHLEDLLRIAHHLWAGDTSPFVGTHHRLEAPASAPAPASVPHPPILVGGTGERRTLALVARYADACNLFDIPDDGATVRHKLAVLARHCDAAGRPTGQVETTLSTRVMPGQPPGAFTRHCADLAGLGIDHVVVLAAGAWTGDAVRALAPTVAELAAVRTTPWGELYGPGRGE
ncbi:TIGR03560 family F420-dependent LLM class oxidoreductase [Georgenia sp. SYP-B2076]|uniref:TIGR03560 family F420-dependent LLM class oxidoreductase n=1 Tax=Georgenia sp. SYP-B2076 TaxID=2495881 RepID=UPI000F8F1E00|nr:TIGR03560 family F420-dependent LLM class oxidoreductase [Georgenia sp. SYP-B2076]